MRPRHTQSEPTHQKLHPARRPEPFCENCTSVVICIENNDDSWIRNAIRTCSKSDECINGTCTTAPEPICGGTADLDFVCTKMKLSNPFFCNNGTWEFGRGRDGYGYGAGTSACNVKLDGGQCQEGDYPVPLCNYIGRTRL
jgi:hypothetical protein